MFSNFQGILKRDSNRQYEPKSSRKSVTFICPQKPTVVYGQSGKPGTSDLQDALRRHQLKNRRVSKEQ